VELAEERSPVDASVSAGVIIHLAVCSPFWSLQDRHAVLCACSVDLDCHKQGGTSLTSIIARRSLSFKTIMHSAMPRSWRLRIFATLYVYSLDYLWFIRALKGAWFQRRADFSAKLNELVFYRTPEKILYNVRGKQAAFGKIWGPFIDILPSLDLADRGGVSLLGPASKNRRCRGFFSKKNLGVHNDVYVVNTVLVYVDITVYGWVYVNCIKTVWIYKWKEIESHTREGVGWGKVCVVLLSC